MKMNILFITLIMIGIIITIITVPIYIPISRYIADGKTGKFLLKIYSNNPRKFSIFCSVSAAIGLIISCGTASILLFYDGAFMFLPLVVVTAIGTPIIVRGTYRNLLKLDYAQGG